MKNEVVHFDSDMVDGQVNWSLSNKQLIDAIVELNPYQLPNDAFFHMWKSGMVKFFASFFKGNIVAIIAHVRTPSPTNKKITYSVECLNVSKPFDGETEFTQSAFIDFVSMVSQADNVVIVKG